MLVDWSPAKTVILCDLLISCLRPLLCSSCEGGIKPSFSKSLPSYFSRVLFCRAQEPDALDSLKMEVGIEDCLHIEFEYDKSAYHLQDVVIGKVLI